MSQERSERLVNTMYSHGLFETFLNLLSIFQLHFHYLYNYYEFMYIHIYIYISWIKDNNNIYFINMSNMKVHVYIIMLIYNRMYIYIHKYIHSILNYYSPVFLVTLGFVVTKDFFGMPNKTVTPLSICVRNMRLALHLAR